MGSACRPRSFQPDQAVETQRGKTLNNSTMSCETDKMPQVVSRELPHGRVCGRVSPNTLRDSKYTVYSFREEKCHFRPGDGQAVEVVAEPSVSRAEGKTPSRHVTMGEWKVALAE